MALSLGGGGGGGGRRRRSCRAERRGDVNGGPGCRHFHVHVNYHIPRQVWAFSPPLPPRLPPRLLLVLPPVLFLAVLAFLVCFGWLTLLYLASSLWSRGMGRAGDANGFAEEDDEREEEEGPMKLVTEHAAGRSGLSEGCVEGKEVREAEDRILEECRCISSMASRGICISDDERSDDEKIVKEVMMFEPCKAFAELGGSASEKHQLLMDIPIDCCVEVEELSTKEFCMSFNNTTKLLDVLSIGEVFDAKTEEIPVLSSTEIQRFIDKHDTAEILVKGAGTDFAMPEDIKQEQSLAELSVDTVPEKLTEDVTDKWQETQTSVTEHNNKQPEAASSEEYREQTVGISDESHDSVCEMPGLLIDSVCENISKNATASNILFHQTNSDEDTELREDLILDKRVESSTSASAVCDFANNHWRIMEELGGSAKEENVHEEGTSVLETVEDEDEDNDNCVSMGAPRRLPLVRRSPAPWWNLCGVLHVFAGGED